MSLTGILLDVSGSMKRNIGSGTDEEGGPWAQSIFNVIDDLIEHDLTSEDRVFAIGVGAEFPGKEIFDVIGTLNRPATEDHINEIFDFLERNGARNIRKWACDFKLIQDVLSDYMATLTLQELKSDEQFVKKFVDEFLPPSCRDRVQTASHAGGQPRTQPSHPSERSAESIPISFDPRTGTFTNQNFHFQSRGAQNESWASWLAGSVQFGLRTAANMAENATVSAVSCIRSATREEIEEVVRKAKCYLEDSSRVLKNVETRSKFSVEDAPRILKDVVTHSIFTVQDASRIIRGCVGEKGLNELSKERKQELLENVEPFIYGGTPLYGSLEKAIKLFERDRSKNKLLFVLSDGEPADGRIGDIARINQITSELNEAGVKTVSCFITASTNIDPKRLYDEIPPPPTWEHGAEFLFSLSSEVRTQDLVARAILVKRGWKIDIAKNETKLFMQVNHPDNLREACKVAKNVVCSSDALSELLISVDIDIYINRTTSGFTARDQGEESTCYAFASATVLHLAMQRFHGREEGCPSFDKLKDEMIDAYGRKCADTRNVLEKMCRMYNLCCRQVCVKEAKEAIVAKRPVVARFRLTAKQWDAFDNFYENNPTDILTKKELGLPRTSKTEGHAVVLMSYNSKCLIFMDSCGPDWPKIVKGQDEKSEKILNGIFKVENADVLPKLEFFDVFWELNTLTERQKEYYQNHKSEVAERLRNSLKGLQKAEYTCPECKQTSLVTEFTGTLLEVQCPKCSCKFSTNDNAGNILALNIYLTTLSE
ncbi:Hypothetical predicted protein [Paramuricea clavata]|uniref:Uncharacterized protein n=1 Tax=Paramuricea clavata TaxID=317549 RepID=A0A7D9DSK0_PARCT|nr:Hypothetical predicted protein [Paramuricea clavata]